MFVSYLDAARSRAINEGLIGPLTQLRARLAADVAYVVYRRRSASHYDVVAGNCEDEQQAFLPGESVAIPQGLNLHLPRTYDGLRIAAQSRAFCVTLSSALVVPWQHSDGRAWLVVGNMSPISQAPNAADDAGALDMLEVVKRAYLSGSTRGSKRLDRLFSDSIKRLSEAKRRFDTPFLLQSTASIARWLFGSSAAYVALPSADGERYKFVATDRIRTEQFRHLALGPDEGIGGLARRCGAPVGTIDYAQDPRLTRAPKQETFNEGFKSAACAPLWWDGEINGLLYIAQRGYRAFNDIDLDLLERFASQCAEAISLDRLRSYHLDNMRRGERDRLAGRLHDHVVRHLLDVGITASLSSAEETDPAMRCKLEEIQHKAQLCIDAVRDFIAQAADARRCVALAPRSIAAELETVPLKNGVTRTVALGDGCRNDQTVAPELAEALTIIGKEALSNADRHSSGGHVRVFIERAEGVIRMRVDDDGEGMEPSAIVSMLQRPGHLGLQRMRAVAQLHGGTCQFGKSDLGGLRVDASLPLRLGA